MLTLTLGIDILFEKLIGMNMKSTFSMQFHAKPVFFFNIFTDNPHVHVLFMGFMSGLPNYWYNGRRYNLKGVCWCVDTDPGNFCPEGK